MKLEVPYFKQEKSTTCGPACIRMVLEYNGIRLSEKELEDIFGNVFEEAPNKAPETTQQDERRKPDTVVNETSWGSRYKKPEAEIIEAESLETIEDEIKAQSKKPIIQVAHDEEEKERVELEEIELEKAIIYSEVINRKYF